MVSSLSTTKSALTHAQASNDPGKRFEDIVQKIRNTLIIAPVASMPSVVSSVRVRRVFYVIADALMR